MDVADLPLAEIENLSDISAAVDAHEELDPLEIVAARHEEYGPPEELQNVGPWDYEERERLRRWISLVRASRTADCDRCGDETRRGELQTLPNGLELCDSCQMLPEPRNESLKSHDNDEFWRQKTAAMCRRERRGAFEEELEAQEALAREETTAPERPVVQDLLRHARLQGFPQIRARALELVPVAEVPDQ